jgi:hypothetical protein
MAVAIANRQIFGDENARLDVNLYKCRVPFPNQVETKPILSGRWGVGKTATFLLRHRELSSALRQIDQKYAYIWYLDESGLDSDTLFHLNSYYRGDRSTFKHVLESFWQSEITRTHARVLNILYDHYGKPSGAHWSKVCGSRGTVDRYARSIWHNISLTLQASGEVGKAVASAIKTLTHEYSEDFEEALQHCLADISEHKVVPAVVIEPIETPHSILESSDISLSQIILVSLLDIFTRKLNFSPQRGQYLKVEISIPWHRSVRDYLREPQKLPQYMGTFSWDNARLLDFMNKRIENEFHILKRQVSSRRDTTAWDMLFAKTVRNLRCACDENSFSYFLRHTHHRTRDLMRLARTVIHTQADLWRQNRPGLTTDDILGGNSGVVTPTAIRQGVSESIRDSSEDRISEASRKYPNIRDIIDLLRGIDVPFTESNFSARAKGRDEKVSEMIAMLWESGIIGFEIIPKPGADIPLIERNVGSHAVSEYTRQSGERGKRYFLFEYNTELSITHIERTFNDDQATRKIVMHPVFFESLGARVMQDYPIGV